MKKFRFDLGIICIVAASSLASGQVGVETDPGAGKIFHARNNGSSTNDGSALFGENKPAPNWGIGVTGDGGYKGVVGYATSAGAGNRYAGYFYSTGGTSTNYGIYSYAWGGAGNYAGYFDGNVTVTGTFANPSDERLKRNVTALGGALDKVLSLRPATYYFDNSILPVKGLPKGKQFGLLAGDLEAVLPELVQENPVHPDAESKDSKSPPETYRSVNYIGLIPVLIGAIKEQQAQIASLQAALKK
jgi:endosialidase-like protein